jgi:hypothetical protein
MVIAAGGAVFAMLGLSWYSLKSGGADRTAWDAVDEVGFDLALAGIGAGVGLLGVVLGGRLPFVLALLGAVSAMALIVLLAYRSGTQPSLPLPAARYETEVAPTLAIIAAACLLAASLVVVAGSRVKTCPDCAERISRSADLCPHCGHLFAPPHGWKRCPHCHGKARERARVCKHCRHDLTAQTV